jgi:hypothetical protein
MYVSRHDASVHFIETLNPKDGDHPKVRDACAKALGAMGEKAAPKIEARQGTNISRPGFSLGLGCRLYLDFGSKSVLSVMEITS